MTPPQFRTKAFASYQDLHAWLEHYKLLEDCAPRLISVDNLVVTYLNATGCSLEEVCDSTILERFLKWAKNHLWSETTVSDGHLHRIREKVTCAHLLQPLEDFQRWSYGHNYVTRINQLHIPPFDKLSELLKAQLSNSFLEEYPITRIHGDCHLGNIIYDPKTTSFLVIDWSDHYFETGGRGIWPFDVAQLYYSIRLPYHQARTGQYSCMFDNHNLRIELASRRDLDCVLLDYSSNCLSALPSLTGLRMISRAGLHANPLRMLMFGVGMSLVLESLHYDYA